MYDYAQQSNPALFLIDGAAAATGNIGGANGNRISYVSYTGSQPHYHFFSPQQQTYPQQFLAANSCNFLKFV